MGKEEWNDSRMRQAIGAARIALGKPGVDVDTVTYGDVMTAAAEDLNIVLTFEEASVALTRARDVLSENVVEFPSVVPIPENRSETVPNLIIAGSAIAIGTAGAGVLAVVAFGAVWIYGILGPASVIVYGALIGAGVRLAPETRGAFEAAGAWWATLVRRARALGERP